MKKSKLLKGVALSLLMCSLVACGAGKTGKARKSNSPAADSKKVEKGTGETDVESLLKEEAGSKDEAAALYQKLMAREVAIQTENPELWQKVFLAADKEASMVEDGTNYGDFLLKTIESAKDQFQEDELTKLRAGAEEIRKIEGRLTILEQKYPGCETQSADNGTSVPAESASSEAEGTLMKFPAFEGKDLDGKDVKSSELFAGNSVTVVNFWFTTCKPCVDELSALDALNQKLTEKGGAVVGVNSFTLDGDAAAIAEAKDLLAKKSVSYRNLWFGADSEAGKFTAGIYSFPTTYVVDQAGNIVGEPIVGAISETKQAERLNQLIEQAIANSKK